LVTGGVIETTLPFCVTVAGKTVLANGKTIVPLTWHLTQSARLPG
jgi:hypothetical protein